MAYSDPIVVEAVKDLREMKALIEREVERRGYRGRAAHHDRGLAGFANGKPRVAHLGA